MKRFLPSVFFIMALGVVPSFATTRTTATCSQSDVNTAVQASVDGDIVIIHSGTCSWSTGVTVPNNIGITIIGSGTPTSDPSKFVPDSSCTATTLNVTIAGPVFSTTPTQGNTTTRISCMVINASTQALGVKILGTCLTAGCPDIRIDNIKWTGFTNILHGSAGSHCSLSINCITNAFGVLDHNNAISDGSNYLSFADVSHAQFPDFVNSGAPGGTYGDYSWANPEYYGTKRFIFMENNTFFDLACCENENDQIFGSFGGGGREVIRYNKFLNMVGVGGTERAIVWHGTEVRQRSPRAYEVYGNTYECNEDSMTICAGFAGLRGGTGIMWNNFITAPGPNNSLFGTFLEMDNFRSYSSPGPWGPCDGSDPYDVNDGIVYFDGLISDPGTDSGFDRTITVTDSMGGNPNWSTNQWYTGSGSIGNPYSIHDLNVGSCVGCDPANMGGNGAQIAASNQNQLYWTFNSRNERLIPHTGDHIQILRASRCIDQTGGRGAGFKYTGNGATTYTNFGATPFPQSSMQAASPTYVWLTTTAPTIVCQHTCGISTPNALSVIANRDYYIDQPNDAANLCSGHNPNTGCSPFAGSSGVGHGPLSERPTSCTTGVLYWSTNEGGWNATVPTGQSGLGYTCTATNVWSNTYTPFPYPHILDANGKTYYVSKTGSDMNACTSGIDDNSHDKATIAAGLGCLSSGDALNIHVGTYAESILGDNGLVPSGLSDLQHTIVQGFTGEHVIMNGCNVADGAVFSIYSRSFITLNNLDLDATNCTNAALQIGEQTNIAGNTPSTFFLVENSIFRNALTYTCVAFRGDDVGNSNLTFLNNQIHDCGTTFPTVDTFSGHGIYPKIKNSIVDGNTIYNIGNRHSGNEGAGIHQYDNGNTGMDNNIFRNNIIHDTTASCIVAAGGDKTLIYNNVCYGGGSLAAEFAGIQTFSGETNAKIYNNTIYGAINYMGGTNGYCIWNRNSTTGTVTDNNICYNNATNTIQDDPGNIMNGANNHFSNPNFVNAGAGNFHLTASIPGTPLSSVFSTDRDGNNRSAWDVGAFEFTGDTLSFSQQPTSTISGNPFNPTVTVTAKIGGVTDTNFTSAVTLTISACGAANTGTATVNASAGVATFTGLGVSGIGTACAETATASGVAAILSSSFDVTSPNCVPDHLVFTAQPQNTRLGQTMGTVTVSVVNSAGNLCPGATNVIRYGNDAGSCTTMVLSGTTSGAAVPPTGSFSASNLVESGSTSGSCQLDAASTGLTGATSNSFTVGAAAAGSRGRRKGRL